MRAVKISVISGELFVLDSPCLRASVVDFPFSCKNLNALHSNSLFPFFAASVYQSHIMRSFSAQGHPDHDSCGTGFIVRLGDRGSHEVVERALAALQKLTHRGGVDADGSSGDGAGLLTAIPQKFIRNEAMELGMVLPRDC